MSFKLFQLMKKYRKDPAALLQHWIADNPKLVAFYKTKTKSEILFLLLDAKLELEIGRIVSTEEREVIRLLEELNEGRNFSASLDKKAFQKETRKQLAYIQNLQEERNNQKKAQVEALAVGRDKAIQAKQAKSKAILGPLEKAIRDYLTAHLDRKVSNKELFSVLSKRGFEGSGGYTASSLEKKISQIAAKIRKEFSV